MRLDVSLIAAYTHAEVVAGPRDGLEVCGITWDSREVCPGFAYVALPGSRVDGHDFVAAAFEAGAHAVLISQPPTADMLSAASDADATLLKVASTADAFTDLARGWRSHLRGRVIGLTGSVGKTTTKNLVRDVLASRFSVVATKANQNNELGVPRTLLSADADTEMVVVEMGMRGLGQISELCGFVKPEWGVVTNVGESHIELLGSRENIARAKGELVASLPEGTGVAFLNDADDRADFLWEGSGASERGVARVGFGSSTPARDRCVWAQDVRLDEEGRPHFTLCCRGFAEGDERVACTLVLRGAHSVCNATAAAAVGRMAGIPLEDIAAALSASAPESGRQEVLRAEAGYTVVNDAYNASPDSMRASLSLLAAMRVEGRRVAVLGDMGELGSFAEQAHRTVGAAAAAAGLDRLVCVGSLARLIAEGARDAGLAADRIAETSSRDEALAVLKDYLAPGDAVLVKASHSMELDRIAKGLLN